MKRIALLALSAACTLSDPPETGTTSGEVDVTWTDAVGVATAGNSLTKTGATGWNAGAASVETIASEGYVEFTTGESTTAKMAGLSVGNAGQHHSDIDYAFYLKATGVVGVYEGGVQRDGNVGTYAAGDVFRVEASGGVVTYALNGTVVYTSAVVPGSPLRVDTSLNTPGATLNDVELVATGVAWQNPVGVAVSGIDITKIAGESLWNAGASSVDTLTGNGFVEFRTGESTTAKMAGLGNGDSSQHYSDIEYALWLKANGTVGVYESGVLRDATVAAYAAGDVFRVSVIGNAVTYSVNGQSPFYTSAVAPSFPLRLDTSLYTPGATIRDARVVASAVLCQGPFVIWSAEDVDAIDECTEIGGDLTMNVSGTLPALTVLRGGLTLNTGTFSAPALTVVHGRIFAESGVTSISLPSLVSAWFFKAGRRKTFISNLDLSSLAFLGGGGGVFRGVFWLETPRNLASLSLPALRSIEGAFLIPGDSLRTDLQTVSAPLLESCGDDFAVDGLLSLTSIDFSSLTSVGPSFTISSNPVLPDCYATDLRDQLLAAGWTGTVTISGNDPDGTCP